MKQLPFKIKYNYTINKELVFGPLAKNISKYYFSSKCNYNTFYLYLLKGQYQYSSIEFLNKRLTNGTYAKYSV